MLGLQILSIYEILLVIVLGHNTTWACRDKCTRVMVKSTELDIWIEVVRRCALRCSNTQFDNIAVIQQIFNFSGANRQ